MRCLVLLFIFIFSPLAFNASGSYGKTEIGKTKELVKSEPILKTAKDKLEEAFSEWKVASATYYDPLDTAQTKKNPDGRGTSGRIISFGSVALGSSFTESIWKEKMEVFIEVRNLKNEVLPIVTPYGIGIFRVDDSKPWYYKDANRVHIDFFQGDLNLKYRRLGRFKILFKIVKIQMADA